MRSNLARITLFLLLPFVVGCASAPTPVAQPTTAVTVGEEHGPAGCRSAEVAAHITAFVLSFNQGSPTTVETFFGSGPPFRWYSVTTRRPDTAQNEHFVAYRPVELPAYFAARHQQDDQLHLRTLHIAGWDEARNIVNFSFTIDRQATDLPPPPANGNEQTRGKGAFDCAAKRIVVWSMATDLVANTQ